MYGEGLKMVLETGFFTYKENQYTQIYELPMGGCISINIAGILMNFILDKTTAKRTLIQNYL